jgi:hypothetical protein
MINTLKNMTLTQFLKNVKTFTGDYTMAMKPKKMMRGGGGVGGGMVKPMRSGGGVGGSVVKGAVKKGKKK